jgi:hypothetical protein
MENEPYVYVTKERRAVFILGKKSVLVMGTVIISLIIFASGCQIREPSASENDNIIWESFNTEPSLSLNAIPSNNPIDFNLLIKDNPDEIIIDLKTLQGNMLFNGGSLTIINAGLKLPHDAGIEFLNQSGIIRLDSASLTIAALTNAIVELNCGAELHLFTQNPMSNSTINMSEQGGSVYFHEMSAETISAKIISQDIITVGGKAAVPFYHGDPPSEISFNVMVLPFNDGFMISSNIHDTE